MSRPIPFIQIGVANRGATVLWDLRQQYTDRFEPVAFVDVEPTFLDAARSQTGMAHVSIHTKLADALGQHPEAEAVFIVTPAQFHAVYIREAIGAGKHVWVEKPLTYSYAEAVDLAKLAKRQQRAVVVGNQYQYHPLERQLQRVVAERRYGQPVLVSYLHHRHRPEMRAFTGPYPALWEQGVHSLNSVLAILGNPALRSVYALSQKPPHSTYRSDTITTTVTQFAGGVQAHVLNTFDSHRSDWQIRVECTDAALLIEADGWQRDRILVLKCEKVVETLGPAADLDESLRDPYAAFYTAITTGKSTPTSIDVNLKTIQWIDAAIRSIESQQVVTF
ncbi:MAG: Gfo/Idh/MocA family oxidoreductase [Caldilineaceae bacterium]|nr:Gfo/Idh/MocA family oxidoreductase [Caldilineaceae bacterium]